MRVETRLFGPLEVAEDKVLHLREGLYGLEALRRFVLIETSPGAPWKWMQSLDDGNISFVVVDPFVVQPGYAPTLAEEDLARVDLTDASEAALLAIAVVPEDIRRMTVNLRAPLVFNPRARLGRQVILPDERYPVKCPVFAALSRSGEAPGEPASGRQDLASVVVGG